MISTEMFGEAIVVGIFTLLALLPVFLRIDKYIKWRSQQAAVVSGPERPHVEAEESERDLDKHSRLQSIEVSEPEAEGAKQNKPPKTVFHFLVDINEKSLVAVVVLVITYSLGVFAIQVWDDIFEDLPRSIVPTTFEKKVFSDAYQREQNPEIMAHIKNFQSLEQRVPKELSVIRAAEIYVKKDEGTRSLLEHERSYIHLMRGLIGSLMLLSASLLIYQIPDEAFDYIGRKRTEVMILKNLHVGWLILLVTLSLALWLYFEEHQNVESRYEALVFQLYTDPPAKETAKDKDAESARATLVDQVSKKAGEAIVQQPLQ